MLGGCSVSSPETSGDPQSQPITEEPATPAAPPPVVWPTDYTPPSTFVDAKLQVGPWVPFPANVEEPFINILHASSVSWEADGWTTEELYAAGHIDVDTGLPVSFPAGVTSLVTSVYFT
ncbi:MAG: hypothetical protein ACX939_04410, partial [Hyphococcus sp.]